MGLTEALKAASNSGSSSSGSSSGSGSVSPEPITKEWSGAFDGLSGDVVLVRIGDFATLNFMLAPSGSNAMSTFAPIDELMELAPPAFPMATQMMNQQGHLMNAFFKDGTLLIQGSYLAANSTYYGQFTYYCGH